MNENCKKDFTRYILGAEESGLLHLLDVRS